MNKTNSGKVLFVGMGGGNDVFSTVLAALSLKRLGWNWDECAFAGVLSPFHGHSNEYLFPSGIVPIVSGKSIRMTLAKGGGVRIGFVDEAVARLVKETHILGSTKVLGLSIKKGSQGLAESFEILSKTYDRIVLVDVGGDCFYRGPKDPHVLSPMFDAIVLRAFIDSGVEGILFEAGPGTDGELEPEALTSILTSLNSETHPLSTEDMTEWEKLYLNYIHPVRKGKTVPMTIEAFKSEERFTRSTYRARAHMNKLRMYTEFIQRIDTKLAKQFFLIDPWKIRNPFAVHCSSPLDWFKKTQVAQNRTNCEANLELFFDNGLLVQILTPSPLFNEDGRKLQLTWGLEALWRGKIDRVLILKHDWQLLSSEWKKRLVATGDDLLTVKVKS